jgi:hypothetical protein
MRCGCAASRCRAEASASAFLSLRVKIRRDVRALHSNPARAGSRWTVRGDRHVRVDVRTRQPSQRCGASDGSVVPRASGLQSRRRCSGGPIRTLPCVWRSAVSHRRCVAELSDRGRGAGRSARRRARHHGHIKRARARAARGLRHTSSAHPSSRLDLRRPRTLKGPLYVFNAAVERRRQPARD